MRIKTLRKSKSPQKPKQELLKWNNGTQIWASNERIENYENEGQFWQGTEWNADRNYNKSDIKTCLIAIRISSLKWWVKQTPSDREIEC